MTPEDLMRSAIDAARRGILAGQTPFGCAIALDGKIVAARHNTVWLTTDITAHAEVNAIREACRRTNQIHLEGMIVATTCEPCPMCMAALHWARVSKVYFGAQIQDAEEAGFNEMQLSARQLVALGKSKVELIDSVERQACVELFELWKKSEQRRSY